MNSTDYGLVMDHDSGQRARAKRRVHQHAMEEASLTALRHLLPATWVIHDCAPDYGIDKVIEV
ncbi:MAG: hypothetical protein QOI20_924, partial [Acidimicrobiaceae bacterium]|nr:hypothetical protein [Acidimicrobiaceae bacterium]